MARDLFEESGISPSSEGEGRDLFAESGIELELPAKKKRIDRSTLDVIRDVGVTALKGAIGLPEAFVGLADIPTGGRVGKALEEAGFRPGDARKILDGEYSEAQQAANQEVRSAEGFIPTIEAALENPSTIATTVGESLPQMLGGAALARGGLALAPKMGAVVAGALGEGVLGAGSAASQIRGETADGLLTPKQAAIAAATGVGTGVLGVAGGKLASRMGVGDVDTMLAQGGGKLANTPAGFVKAVAAGGISEGAFEELPQSVQEQMLQNWALDKPITEGVGNAAAMGLLSGVAMGGAGGGVNALRQPGVEKPAAEPAPETPAAPAPAAPATGSTGATGATSATPAADPTTRLAELELTAGTRELTEPERQEAAALFEQLQAAEDAENQGPTDVQNPTQPPPASVQPEAPGAEAPAPEGGDGAATAGPAAAPGAGGLEAPGVDPRQSAMDQATQAAQRVLQDGGTEADANRAATDALIAGMDQAPDIEIAQDAPAAVQAARTAVESAPILPPMQEGPDVNLQNRDRGRAASVIQMTEIARNPDYMRLGPSRTPDSGAPMVFAVGDDTAAIPPENFGREDLAVMSDGQQVGFRYAVADATKVNPSNFADGRANEAFNSDLPGTIKALNNGRTAGIRGAHEMGTAGQYVEAMQGDAQMHGISPDVIARTPNPILVRVYADADNTAGMAAKSQGQGLGMSPSELARQDAPLMDASVLGVYQTGDVTSASNRDFVRAFVGKLQGAGQDVAAMMTGNGELSQDGRKRIQAALMQAAYGDADLVDEMFDSTDTDLKSIGEALKTVAGEWANMRDSARLGVIDPSADITENLLQVLGLIRKARRDRSALTDLVNQPDLLTGQAPDAITVSVLRMFYNGQYFTRAVGRDKLIEALGGYVRGAMRTSAEPGMFGDDVTVDQLLGSIGNTLSGEQDAQTQPENSGAAPAGGRPGGVDAAAGEREERGPIAAPRSPGPGGSGTKKPAENQDQTQQQNGQGNQGGAQGEGEGARGEVKPPKAKPAPKPKAQKPAKGAPEPRAMTYEGRATDGKPLMPGDTFRTSSGRITTGFPKQSGQRYLSQWLINNALMEAESRGDDFNARTFLNTKPLKSGELTPADGASLNEYLFGDQPAVVPSILKPLTGRADATPAAAPDAEPLLTSPTAEDILAQQERAEREAELTQREQTQRESQVGDNSFMTGFDGDGRQDTTGGLFDAPAEPEPSAADLAKAKAAEDLKNALGDLGDIFGKDFKANMLPEQEQKLLPVLTRVMDAAFRLGYLSFKDAAKYALDQIRTAFGQPVADAITLEHLQGAYIGMSGRYKEQGADSVRTVSGIEDKADVEKHTARAAGDAPAAPASTRTLTRALYEAINAGNMPKDNPGLKKLVEAFDGKPADQSRMKQAQEELETAIVMVSRDVVAKREGDRTTYDVLLRLYESQPNLNIRTSTSIANQAYSTPAPLAYLASRLAGITRTTVTHEPTAGTGMLLIGSDQKRAIVNELNDVRIAALKSQGFAPTQKDAATQALVPSGTRPDAVVTNPPFGSVKDAEGKPVKVQVDGYNIGQIDHLIAARALDTMKEDGRATLIIGANKAPGGLSTDDRIFFNWLYSHYNVVGHFELDGDLYARQGAGWPVRVITINGRQASSKISPIAGTIPRVDNWTQVYEQFTQSLQAAESPRVAPDAEGGRAPATGAAPVKTGAGRPAGGTPSPGNVAGAGPRVVPDRAKPAREPVAPAPDEQRLNAQSHVPQPQPGQGSPASTGPAKPAGASAVTAEAQANEFQTPYTPRSARKDEGVLIPSNMAQPTQDALSRLEDAVGDIDEFARTELGYESVEQMHGALMGLQVDSVATAIYQIKQGKAVVIADQTGIGKGRQAASIIRWAARNGMTPVFVSVKPSLFTDMYGDLADIGTTDVSPFIMNADAWVAGEGGAKLFANKKPSHKNALQSIADTGQLPEGSNALFMTYSQINVANTQRQALMALAPNAVFVLDESHNAAGESATGQFVIDVLGLAKGVTYLSATYAKRPDNMPLYFKTDIGEAAADTDGLAIAMAAGGLPLQTVVSNNLVKAGQMFRRERSYDGVSIASTFDTPNRALHERMSNEATKALRAIVAADRMFHGVFVKQLADQLAEQGASVRDSAGNQMEAGVQHTEFSSVVHNFVKQMLLGLKAQSAANEAIASLKRGEKPIIAVENTMGSFLNEYAASNGITQGESLGSFDYRTVLSRALLRSRVIVEVAPTGQKTKRQVSLGELDRQTRAEYDAAQQVIDNLVLDIPVSPIDWMRAEIIRAGFSVAEITGRDLSVDYTDPNKAVLSAIDAAEQKDKVNTTRRFNSGALDALILNVAGSTGISLHASEKFEDQRQRHMIVAQAAGDINIFMQMLGRVHRTGQVRLPKYTILSVDLPTEKRPTAVLSIKMKSLNANTSSNTESATSVKSSDILNKYGDQIVNQYLVDNYALARALDLEEEIGVEPGEDIARKATGRLALQPIEVQMGFYEEVEAQYTALIDYLNKTNQNDLEPRTFDFDAKEVRQEVLFDGPNKDTPFGEDAIYGEYSIKAQGAPMKPQEIRATMVENLGGVVPKAHMQAMLTDLDAKYQEYLAQMSSKTTEALATAAAAKNPDGTNNDNKELEALGDAIHANAAKEGAANVREAGRAFLNDHKIGSIFRVDINSEPFNAIVLNVRNTHKETGNPYSLSKIQLTVAVNGALRSLSVPATQFKKIEVSGVPAYFEVEALFKEQPPNQRETAKIVTGNLLAAYGEMQGSRGTIITFTKQDGTSEQGILLPKLFDYSKNTRGDYRLVDGAAALKFLQQSDNKDIGRFGIMTRDGNVRVLPSGRGIRVQVPKSKLKGGKYFLDKALIEAGGDFVSSGPFMVSTVQVPASAVKMLDLLMKKQALYALPSMADEAKAIAGGDTTLSIDAEQTRADTSTYGTATQAHRDLVARFSANFGQRLNGGPDANLLDAVAPTDTGTGRAAKAVRGIARRLFAREVVYVKFAGRQLFNGAVSSSAPGVIFINIDSPRPYMAVLGHELLHQMAKSQPDIYKGLSESLDKFIKGQMTYSLRTVAAYKAAGIDLKGLDTREELEADIMGDSFTDEKFWGAIAQDQPSLFKRWAMAVIEWLDTVVAKLGPQRTFGTEEFLTDVAAARAAVVNAVRQFSAAEVGAVTDPTNGPDADVSMSVASQRQTDTPAFKRWFAGSKVVDAQGQPLVVYHGTTASFDQFDPAKRGSATGVSDAKKGFFFAASGKAASEFTYSSGDMTGNVMPVYLALQNPLTVNIPGEWAPSKYDAALDQAKAQGNDGLIVRGATTLGTAGDYFIAFKPEQIKSAIGNRGTFDPASSDITLSIFGNPVRQPGPPSAWQKLKTRVNTLTSRESLDRLVYEYQDKLVDLKRIRDHIKDIGGTITDLNDAYLGEELYHKRVAKRTQDFLADELKPLLADMRLRGVDMPTLEKFLHARHAPEANKAMAERNPNKLTIDTKKAAADAQVRALERQLQTATNNGSSTKALTQALDQAREERARWTGAQAFKGTEADRLSLSGMSDQEATSLMTGLSKRARADLDALASMVDAINAKTVNALEAYGLMDTPSLNAWRKAYQFYVPLHRDEAHPDSTSHPVGQGFSTKGNASKQRTGSNAKVTNILGHIAMQREAALTRGEKNQVVKKLYVMAAQNPDPALWAVDKPPMVKTIDKDTGLVRSGIDPTYKNKPNVLMVRISGKDAAIVFNEQNPNATRLAESMKNLDVGDLDAFSNIMAKGTRWLASVNTQYNPIFGLVNFARDVQGATLQLSSTAIAGSERQVLADTPKALRAIYRQVRGKSSTGPWTKLWEELQNEGGTTGYRELFMKPDERAKQLEKELKALDRGQATRAAVAVVDWLSDFNEAIENGVRLATYKAALDMGLTKPRAASLAKNITVNFNRRGRQTAKLGAYYAFLNAAIQGTTRMVETLKGPAGKKIMLGGVMLGALNTLLGMAVMGAGDDDEEEDNWEKIPDFVKERNVIIPLGREDYLTIPMPLGFNVLPNIGRKAVEMMLHDDPTESRGKHVGELALIILDSFNPFGGSENVGQLLAPTVFDPVVGLMQNKDWTGRQIYRSDMSTLDPTPGFTRTKDSASSFSKGVAEAMNAITGGNEYKPGAISWTPDQIDYVVGQLTGGIGRELMKVEQTLTAPFTGEDLPAYKIPIAGRLYGNTTGPANNSDKFYENVRQLNMVENELKGRAGDGKDVDGYVQTEPLAPLVGAGNAAESQLRKLRAARRAIIAQGTEGYIDQVKEINAQQGQVMKDLNRQVRDAKRADQ